MIVNMKENKETYELLHILDFTSERKRMSILIKDQQGSILLLCKGADSIIFDRSRLHSQPFLHITQQNIQVTNFFLFFYLYFNFFLIFYFLFHFIIINKK